jgi:hypothetical protein
MNDAINIVHLPKIHQNYFSKSAQIKTKFSADFTVPSLQIAANNEGAYLQRAQRNKTRLVEPRIEASDLFDQIYHGTCQEDGRVLHGSRSPGACDAVFYLRILPSSRRHSSYVVPLFCSVVSMWKLKSYSDQCSTCRFFAVFHRQDCHPLFPCTRIEFCNALCQARDRTKRFHAHCKNIYTCCCVGPL